MTVLALPAIAQESGPNNSDDGKSIYISYSGGLTYLPNQRLVGANPSPEFLEGRSESNIGFNVGGAVGMRLHEMIRAEIELGYHRNEVDQMPIKGQRPSAQGYTGLLTVMANAYVDYDLDIGVVPYVGVGIGWGRLELDMKNQSVFTGPLQTSIEGRDHVFTWSLMIGGTYPLSELVDVSLGYKYIATTDADVNSTVRVLGFVDPNDPNNNVPGSAVSRRFETEYDAHEAVLSLLSWIEHQASNLRVGGSNPSRRTTFSRMSSQR